MYFFTLLYESCKNISEYNYARKHSKQKQNIKSTISDALRTQFYELEKKKGVKFSNKLKEKK